MFIYLTHRRKKCEREEARVIPLQTLLTKQTETTWQQLSRVNVKCF